MATIDIFNLSPRDFNLQMQEEAMYRTPAELDELRREYRNRNSMAGKLMGLLAPEEGKRRSTFLPVDAPQGMSIFDALRSGQATPAVPQGLVDLITGGTRGVESAREYAQGVPPRADALNDALAMSGLAMTGGGAIAGRGALEYDPTVTRIFAGPKAKTANVEKLDQAISLQRQGVSEKEILQTTGWSQGADGQWQFEIPDDKAEFIADPNRLPDYKLNRAAGLGDVIRHDELFKAYPELRGVLTSTEARKQPQGSYSRPQGRDEEQIGAMAPDSETLTDVLLHEIDHAVAFREGFPSGSSGSRAMGDILSEQNAYLKFLSESMDKRKDELGLFGYMPKTNDPLLNDLYDKYNARVGRSPSDSDVNERYMRSAGEVSARNVEARRNMTAQERLDTPPEATEDIPRSEQYFNYGSGSNYANASKSAGLLTTAASEAQDMAKRILELRAEGRASEVTDEMMAQADPQYMFANTPLPMDEASRMARAEAAGFEGGLLHGTGADIVGVNKDKLGQKQDLLGTGFYSTTSPKRSERYVPKETEPLTQERVFSEGGNVIPLLAKNTAQFDLTKPTGIPNAVKIGKAFEGSDFDVEYRGEGDQVFIKSKTDPQMSVYIDSYQDGIATLQKLKDVFGRNNVTNILEQAGFSGLKAEEGFGNITNLNYKPTDVRSRFARFDPEFAHLSNLSAANASPIGGLLAQSGVSNKQAERIEEYLRRRGLLD